MRKYPSRQRRSNSFREIDLLDGLTVSEGGWNYSKTWMTRADAQAALSRWARKSYETRGDDDEFQCGGCKFVAAIDTDYGICWNPASPNDGRIVFEHGGCHQHSLLVGGAAR